MNLNEFVQLLYPYLGDGESPSEYLKTLFDNFMEEPNGSQDANGNYNPLYDLTPDFLNRIYNGTEKLAKTKATTILGRLDASKFTDYINETLALDAITALKEQFESHQIQLTIAEIPEKCLEILKGILEDIASGTKRKSTRDTSSPKEKMMLSQMPLPSLSVKGGKIYIGGQTIELPAKLKPPAETAPEELPYVQELFASYAQAEHKSSVTKDTLPQMPVKYERNFTEQRENYYNAESIRRSVREVFSDGEDDFNRLKDDAYDGISDTCWDDFEHGYARLLAVLKQVSQITLSKSYLAQISNWIGNSEKKGVCHMLVNDGRIHWVVDDE